jgi:hypothetical protein
LRNQALDGLAWGAMAVGFIAASLAIIRTPNDEWDLRPLRAVHTSPGAEAATPTP